MQSLHKRQASETLSKGVVREITLENVENKCTTSNLAEMTCTHYQGSKQMLSQGQSLALLAEQIAT